MGTVHWRMYSHSTTQVFSLLYISSEQNVASLHLKNSDKNTTEGQISWTRIFQHCPWLVAWEPAPPPPGLPACLDVFCIFVPPLFFPPWIWKGGTNLCICCFPQAMVDGKRTYKEQYCVKSQNHGDGQKISSSKTSPKPNASRKK